MRLLLVEDDAFLSSLWKRALERAGHDVDAALTGEAAVELAAVRRYDAALVDVLLPVMQGEAVLEALQEAKVPAVVLTGLSEAAARTVTSKFPGVPLFSKPTAVPSEVLAALEGLAGRRRSMANTLSEATQALISTALADRDTAIGAHAATQQGQTALQAAQSTLAQLQAGEQDAVAKAKSSDDAAVQAVVQELQLPPPPAEAERMTAGDFAGVLSRLLPLIQQLLQDFSRQG